MAKIAGRITLVTTVPLLLIIFSLAAPAQVSVTTWRNDTQRTGQNLNETTLNLSNVNTSQFGQLFVQPVDGYVFAQPLYLPNITIAGQTHNVVFVATEHDSVYAFDADTNGGSNGYPLWFASLLTTAHGAAPGATSVPASLTGADIVPEVGITGTPVIDPSSGTLYVVSKTMEGSIFVQRLHALDVTSGAEKFGGPVVITATIPGTGNGSVSGSLTFDPEWENQRPGLLLLNGIVYIGWGSHGDVGPWHGWVMGYNAQTLQQTGVFCSSANGVGSGIWMSGAGLAAEIIDPVNHPYGRMFLPTGNGDYTAAKPYSSGMDFGDSILNLDLTNGVPTVQDNFTPYNQATLDAGDTDQGSGGLMILPTQTAGSYPNLLVQTGKSGEILLLNRENLGGYNPAGDQVVQELPHAIGIPGAWSMSAYFNGTVYYAARQDTLKAFPLVNGQLTGPTATSSQVFSFPGANPVVSANGTSQGIVWAINSSAYTTDGPAVLQAFNAATLGAPIYSTATNLARDNPGPAVKFTVPTVANGKVYVPAQYQLSVYGLLSAQQLTATPVINPASETFAGSVSVSITDTTPGAIIYYTLDGSTPTTNSPVYSNPINISATTTVQAMASAPGYDRSTIASAALALSSQVATPILSPAAGSFTQPVQVSITDASSGAAIYYTTDGSNPATSSTATLYTAPFTLSASASVNAIAEASGFQNSNIATAAYTINLGATGINFPVGFSASQGLVLLNGVANLDDSRLQMTDGNTNEASSAWFYQPVNVQAFTTTFTFQLSNPVGNGITFAIQGVGTSALGTTGSGLGYQGIPNSVAVKFDFNTPVGAGNDSIGLYLNGAMPTTPAIDLSATGINLLSNDTMNVQLAYNGTVLSMIITDVVTGASYSTSWPVNIPSIVGATSAYVGFTGAAGTSSSSQKILTWVYTTGSSALPLTTTPAFTPSGGTYSSQQSVAISSLTAGASIYYTTDGSTPTQSSNLYSAPVAVSSSTTLNAIAVAPGYAASKVASAAYTIVTPLPAPAFSPAAGNYLAAQTVTISDATPGTTIYYTTNGTTPTTSSTVYSGPIAINSTETLAAIAVETGYSNSPAATGSYVIGPVLPAPTFSPAAGTYTTAQSVSIADATAGTTIYYTTNGAPPTTSSAVYTGPIAVGSTETLQAIAVETGYNGSTAASATYNINPLLPAPTFSPLAGTYATAQSVTISDATPGTTIYYTTNGATPTTSSTVYSSAITVSATQTVQAIAVESGYTTSAAGSALYTIGTGPATATPVFSPAGGHYSTAQTVSISDSTANATIYYTTNGATPTTSSNVYSGAIAVSSSQTLEAIAIAPNDSQSKVATANYVFPTSTPVISPAGGAYSSAPTVTITDSMPGAVIYFTTDGTAPTPSSPVYSGPITVVNGETIKAGAVAPNSTQSATAVANYGLKSATPQISPVAGTYAGSQTVTITDATPGAVIYYTTNGTAPNTSSNVYSGPFAINASGTVEALAVTTGYTNSPVATAAMTITAAPPTFSLPPGSYSTTQLVTLSSATPGATIYYTTNGTTPTTSSNVYTGAITVSSTLTVQSIAVGGGYPASPVASAKYTIAPAAATPVFTPAAGTYTTAQSVTISDVSPGTTIYYTTNGSTPATSSSVYSGPISVSATETLQAIAVGSAYTNSSVGSALYNINPQLPPPTFLPAAGTYTTPQSVNLSDATAGTTIYYTTDGSTPTTSSNLYSGAPISVSASETLQAIAVETGYTTSAAGSAIYTINPLLPAPSFSPAAGTYTTTQTVTIADATAGTTIYYTTNGTTPTTSSTLYSGAISVAATETLQAIAVETGYTTSTPGSATYTINPLLPVPAFSPAPATFTTPQTVSITDATPGTTIYYTTNGLAPTTSSSVYSGPISVNATETVQAIAVETGYTTSTPGSATYTINPLLPAPTFFPAGGTYTTTQSVTIADATPGTTIYYTTNGAAPTTSSAVYSGAIPVSASETLQAIAVETGYTTSTAGMSTYTINPLLAAPTFLPSAGTYTAAQSVTIGDSTPGTTIYYTTNGTPPTTASSVYTGPIAVSTSETIQAIAVETGYTTSSPGAAAYTIATGPLAATPVFSPPGGHYSVAQSVSLSDSTPGAIIYYTTNGSTPTASSTVYTGAIAISSSETLDAIAIAPNYSPSKILAQTYMFPTAQPVVSPPGGIYNSTPTVTITDATPGAVIYFTTDGTPPSSSSPVYTGPITVVNGETIKAGAVAPNDTQSSTSVANYALKSATPVISPGAGNYSGAQTVTITDATPGATIYYTTNGTAPTTSSSMYSGPFTISANGTVEAIAVFSGYTNSAVATAAMKITGQ